MTDPNSPNNPNSPQGSLDKANSAARKKELLTFSAACPSCGAPVPFRSSASVMAVCEYCQTTVLREDQTLTDHGKMSALLEDYSPLQIGSSGIYDGINFSLIGRIQLQYPDGMWNEWYLQFDDGSNGWLADASGQYVLTRNAGAFDAAPQFEQLGVNHLVAYKSITYRVTDYRRATCTAGQGELPFVVGKGWQTAVADLRFQARFISLDYSDGYPPIVYEGRAVTLTFLKMQLLRDGQEVQSTTGKVKGNITNLACPNCGSPIPYVLGMAEHLACPSCRAEVAITGPKAETLATHKELTTLKTALSLGDNAPIDGQRYVVIGLMQLEEVGDDESSLWTEYLLYSLEAGFLWLVDSGTADWQKTKVLNEFPEIQGSNVRYLDQTWKRQWAYQGRVLYAVGAFNWRVKIGDTNAIVDFKNGDNTLTSEQNANEINWSLSTPISGMLIRQWFGKKQPTTPDAPTNTPPSSQQTVLKWLSISLWLINLPIMLFGPGSFFLTLIAQFVLIFLPAILDQKESDSSSMPSSIAGQTGVLIWGIIIIVGVTLFNMSSSSSSSNWNGSNGSGYSSGYGGGWSSGGGHK
jgi:hypothetical protein